MRPISLRTRLWIGHALVLTAMLLLATLGADWMLRRIVFGDVIDDALLSLASTEAAALRDDAGPPMRVHELVPGGAPSFTRLDKFVQIIDLQGEVVATGATLGTARLPASTALLAQLRAGETVFSTLPEFAEEPVRTVAFPVTVQGRPYAVQVAMSLDDAYAILRTSRWLLLAVTLAILMGIGASDVLLVSQALQPVEELVVRARRIGETNLHERLPHPGTRDAIGRLVDTLNAMLTRLKRNVEVQRQFTADAAHELRSPLSRLRAEIEVTLRRRRDVFEYEEALHSCLDEVEQFQRLLEELLELARIEGGQETPLVEPIAVRDIVAAAVGGIDREAQRRGVSLTVLVPPLLLARAAPAAAKIALTNILANAVKFSPSGSTVTVSVAGVNDESVIAVSDHGPGVTPADLPYLFQRFYQGAAARAAGIPGVGLGLAISRALLERQGGRISVGAAPHGGAVFSVHLPRA